jgi:hypothetical protein
MNRTISSLHPTAWKIARGVVAEVGRWFRPKMVVMGLLTATLTKAHRRVKGVVTPAKV